MVDLDRQVPAPAAAGWAFSLAEDGAPAFVVLRQRESDARTCLIEHVLQLRVARRRNEAVVIATEVHVQHTEVPW